MDDPSVGDGVLLLLPVVPWTLAALTVVLLVALAVPPGGPREADLAAQPSPLHRRPVAALLAALAVLAVLVLRLGPAGEVRNPVPPLLVGLGLPALLVLPALLSPLGRRRPGPADGDVRPAVVLALGVVVALVVPLTPARPDVLATSVTAYALALVLAAVAVGLRRAAASYDAVGLLAAWGALGPALTRWRAPRGAAAVLAVVLGGAWAERYERSAAWGERLTGPAEVAAGLGGALLLAAAGTALLHRTTGRAAAAVLLPLAFATAVAGGLRRALISGQLLLADSVDPDPLGALPGQAVALALVAVGGALSAAVLARRLGPGAARLPATGVLLVLSAVSAVVVLQP